MCTLGTALKVLLKLAEINKESSEKLSKKAPELEGVNKKLKVMP